MREDATPVSVGEDPHAATWHFYAAPATRPRRAGGLTCSVLLLLLSLIGPSGNAGAGTVAAREGRGPPAGRADAWRRVLVLRGGGAALSVTATPEVAVARQIDAAKNALETTASVCWSDMWLEHAIARCASEHQPLAPQISRASPFLPLLVEPGGLEAVTLMQRRMLLDRSFAMVPSRPSSALPASAAEERRAGAPGVMGPEGIMALQVNCWEPLVRNTTHDEQRLFVRELTQIARDDNDGRHRVLMKFSGRLGRVVIEEWESYLLSMAVAVVSRVAPEFMARAEHGKDKRTAQARAGQDGDAPPREDGLPEEMALVHSICSSLLSFCEETSARLPPEATQRYMHVEMATMGWETIIALLQSTPVGQKYPVSETVWGMLEPNSGCEQRADSGPVDEDCGTLGGEQGLEQGGLQGQIPESCLGKAVFRTIQVAEAFAVVHQALGDCYWERRAGNRLEYPFTASDLEDNVSAALLHYLRAARVYAQLRRQDASRAVSAAAHAPSHEAYRKPLAQACLGAASALVAKRSPRHWTALEEIAALTASDAALFQLLEPREGGGGDMEKEGGCKESVPLKGNGNAEQGAQGPWNTTRRGDPLEDNLEIATNMLQTAVQLLEGGTGNAGGTSGKAAMSPDWVHAHVELAVCFSRRAMHQAAGEQVRRVLDG